MKAVAASLLALALASCATSPGPSEADPFNRYLTAVAGHKVERVLEEYEFEGELAYIGGHGHAEFALGEGRVWPFASISKQIVAVMVMQEVEAGRLELDRPVSEYLPDWPADDYRAPSLRELLRHQSGLYDPEADPAFDLESARPLDPMLCVRRRGEAPGGAFAYKNCDTLLAARVLEQSTGRTIDALLAERITGPVGMTDTGFVTAQTVLPASEGGATAAEITYYSAAGGMAGTARDLLKFDSALMSESLLGEEALAEMWRGEPALGYTALGQWEFTAPLRGCEAPVRIIERRGAIPGYQARNFIVPARGFAMAAFTARSEADYSFGEIWSGEGLSFDLLSAAVCDA